jgi:hypothetical protein
VNLFRRRWRRRASNVRIALALIGVSSSVRLVGMRGALRLIDRITPHGEWPAPCAGDVERSVTLARRIAAVAGRLPGRPRCLSRSLVLRMALRRRRIDNELCIGIRITGEFAAHAWVEVAGVAAGESQDVRSVYARFPTFAGA